MKIEDFNVSSNLFFFKLMPMKYESESGRKFFFWGQTKKN